MGNLDIFINGESRQIYMWEGNTESSAGTSYRINVGGIYSNILFRRLERFPDEEVSQIHCWGILTDSLLVTLGRSLMGRLNKLIGGEA